MNAENLILGTAVHCGRYGCIVRLEDGRIANLRTAEPGHEIVKRAVQSGGRRRFGFRVEDLEGRLELHLVSEQNAADPAPHHAQSSALEEKIIDYLRQTADWDPNGAIAEQAQQKAQPRADRLLPFEMRARSQYRDSKEKPDRKKR